MLARQRSHGVDMLDDKLAVGHPQLHIFQIARVETGLLHGLIEGVKQRVVRLINTHTQIRQFGSLRVGAENQTNGFLVGLQRSLGVLP